MPDAAAHLAGPDNVHGWIDTNALPSDLVLLSGGENPFTVVERLAADDRSLVAIANHQEAGWYSPEGTLGVTTQRR
jgi:hypothetical protein